MNSDATTPNRSQRAPKKTRARERFAVVFKHVRKYRLYLIIGGVSVALAAIFNVVRPYLIKVLLDDLEQGTLNDYGLRLGVAFVALSALSGVFLFLNRRTVIWMSRKLEYDLRGELFGKLLRLPLSFYHENRVGDIMARLTNDIEAVRQVFGPAIMYFANTIVSTILALGIMVYMSPKLTLYIALPMPIVSFLVTRVGGLIHKRFLAIQTQFSVLTAAAQENLSGIRVIKAYSQEPAEIEKFRFLGREYVNKNMSLVRFNALFMPLLFSMGGVITLVALYFGGREIIAGTLTKGTVVSFFVYIAMLFWPIIALGWVVSLYQRGSASMDRINKILSQIAEYETIEEASDTSEEPLTGKVEFRKLAFSYPTLSRDSDESFSLSDISLTLNPGDSLGVVGPVGSGKSTLASLIPRLYNPPRGSLFIDDTDTLDIPLHRLRASVGYVPQESFLFSAKLDANIKFGAPDAGHEEVVRAAGQAALEKDIIEFTEGYDTVVGERGITLSGGQKQRMSIARALIRDPRIIIFDDATSAVDTETDAQIQSALAGELAGRTSIIISHRISSVKNCGRIIYLENGMIREIGSHEELLKQNGPYAELYRQQSLEEELSAD